MEVDQYTRARGILQQVEFFSARKTELQHILNNSEEINRISIGTRYINNIRAGGGGECNFILSSNNGEGRLYQDQPERIAILTRAFVACLLDGYSQELDKLEAEFKAL